VIHADNARPLCAQTVTQSLDHNFRRQAPHPPDPPRLALRLLAFRVSETSAQESSFDEPNELLSAIQKIVRGVHRETLDAGFQEWMIRLQNVLIEMANMLSDVYTEMFNSFV
jgi:hypothetical protein